MARLPCVAAAVTSLKLNLKHPSVSPSSPPTLKSSGNLHQRNISLLHPHASSDPSNLDFRDYNYTHLMELCNSVPGAQIVHAHMIKTSTTEDLKTMSYLVNCYGKCGSLENAHKVFDKLPTKSDAAWTSLMAAYVNNSQPERAIQAFEEMLGTGLFPTKHTFGFFLNVCSSLCSVKLAEQIHAYMIKYQIACDNIVGNALCTFYSKIGMLESAVKAFRRIKEKDVVSWTAVIAACGQNGDPARGVRFFSKMISEEIEPNEITFTCILSLCTKMLSSSVGAQVQSLVIKLGYEEKMAVRNGIMHLYLNCGLIKEARKLFDGTQASLLTWNSMIIGHSQLMDRANGNHDLLGYISGTEALNIFMKLKHLDLKPDEYTFSSILTVCNNMVALDHGEQIHAQAIKTGFLSDVVVGTALVNMYTKCGSVERGTKAFTEMPDRNSISWTVMITGFAHHGRSQQALQLFEDMRLAGVRPNGVTFVGVLWACADAGMVNKAVSYFDMMQREYRISPVADHFACLVDMYLRLGRLEEAYDFVNRSAARWGDVPGMQELMGEEQTSDWSWISIRNHVHFYKPGSLRDGDTIKLLENLVAKARRHGYEAVQRVVESEVLAVAFGMLKTREGVPIRVLKSRGMSRDSHNLLRHASLVSNRKIVVRDSKRLHIFVDGSCPCGGFG